MPRLLVALALASLVCTGRAAGAAPLRIAYSSISGAMLPLWVAKDKKLFEKHGVDIEVTYIRGVAIEAMLANEVQSSAPRRPQSCARHCAAPISRSSRTRLTSRCFR